MTHYSITLDHKQSQSVLYDTLLDHTPTTNNHNLHCMAYYSITLDHKQSQSTLKDTLLENTRPQTITICTEVHTTRSHSTTNNHNLQCRTHYSITLDHKQSQSALKDTLLDHTRPQTITIYTMSTHRNS